MSTNRILVPFLTLATAVAGCVVDDEPVVIEDDPAALATTDYVGRPSTPGEARTTLVRLGGAVQALPYTVKGELAFHDGDILLGTTKQLAARAADGASAHAIVDVDLAWPGAVVPFAYQSGITAANKAVIEQAMDAWEAKTKVRFVPRTSQSDYVLIRHDDDGCYSQLGMVGGAQVLNLEGVDTDEPACGGIGVALHELGHAIGLLHEQKRPDRDALLSVFTSNIDPEEEDQVTMTYAGQMVGSYDIYSIMQYGTFGFSVRDNPVLMRKGMWSVRYGGGGGWQTLRFGHAGELPVTGVKFGDLDNDGKADAIKADATGIYYMPGGVGAWIKRNAATHLTTPYLGVADWNGDGADDLLSFDGTYLRVSLDGTASFTYAGTVGGGGSILDLRFCDFDADGRDDVFRTANGTWSVMYAGTTAPVPLQTNRPEPLWALRFAELDGDGACDVYTSKDLRGFTALQISRGGVDPFMTYTSPLSIFDRFEHFDVADTIHGDFDGDGVVEVFGKRRNDDPADPDATWWGYFRAVKEIGGDITRLAGGQQPDPAFLRVADVNGDGRDDLLMTGVINANRSYLTQRDADAVNQIYGATWQVSWNGASTWQILNLSEYTMAQVAIGDFDGNGKSDVLRTDGSAWWASYNGTGTWTKLNTSGYTLASLRLADLNGDGRTDVFRADGSAWWVSYGATGLWTKINSSGVTDVRLADLNDDGKADVFATYGGKWFASYGGTSGWVQINSSAYEVDELALADFNGDGKADVFRPDGSAWWVSYGATGTWTKLNTSGFHFGHGLAFGDFDGDGKADVFRADGSAWWVSYGGTGLWTKLNTSGYTSLRFGDFDGNGRTDVLSRHGRIVD